MSDQRQSIPQSEIDRIKRTAEETVDPMFQLAWIAGAKSEYLRRERWVSVKERLPEERVLSVLVFNGDAPHYNQCVTEATWLQQARTFKRETTGNYLGTITHWMPIPKPPSEL